MLRDGTGKRWLRFTNPVRILTACTLGDVIPALQAIEKATQRDGLHAAGFIAYEAAPAFDPSLPAVSSDAEFPLLWFGLFEKPEIVESSWSTNASSMPPLIWESSISTDTYRRCIRSIHERIQAGDTYQVNFSYRLRTTTHARPEELFSALTAAQKTPYAAYVDVGEWVVCSASPECFFKLSGETIVSYPMKGTTARGLWSTDDLAQAKALRMSEKNCAENVMIVDMVRHDLGRIAKPGSVCVPTLFKTERYPTVWQMTSTVKAQTTASLTDIMRALFPPASITGAPKKRTMEIIANLENTPRRIYTGAIGHIAPNRRAWFNVAIRTLLLNRPTGNAEYGVGGGIVWDSHDDTEKEECEIKSRVLHGTLPDFELIETILWTPEKGYSLLAYHLKRLAQSAAYFDFRLKLSRVQKFLEETANGLPPSPHRVRLVLNRQGLATCQTRPFQGQSKGFGRIALAKQPVDPKDLFLYHKTTQRRVYTEALAACPGFDDVLLFNTCGEITESTIANVACEIDGALLTPPVRCGLLPGTCRASLLKEGKLRERVIHMDEIRPTTRFFLMNAVRGFHEVRLCQKPPQ